MTSSPRTSAPCRDTFAVTPVVEYEPPTQSVAQCRQASPTAVRPRGAPSLHRQPGGHSGRHRTTAATAGRATPPSAPMRQAAIFAAAALRRVLEVLDHRRPLAQLRPLLAPSLVDSVLSTSSAMSGHHNAAVLRRVRLQPTGPNAPEHAAEVFGTYSRGDRVHAIACRVEQLPTSDATRWLVVALHIG